jgi:membrane protein implicated in regulation of membrane protease activity
MSDLVFNAEIWLIVGLVLVLADIFLGFGLFVLPIGVAALIVAGMVTLQQNGVLGETTLYSNWRGVVYWFAGLSVSSVLLLRLVFQKPRQDKPDINEY